MCGGPVVVPVWACSDLYCGPVCASVGLSEGERERLEVCFR